MCHLGRWAVSRAALSAVIALSACAEHSSALTPTTLSGGSVIGTQHIARSPQRGPHPFSGSRNVYVDNYNGNSVTIFGAMKSGFLRKIVRGINAPVSIAFDSSGNLYVANYVHAVVRVFAPGTSQPLRTIHTTLAPRALLIDRSDHLYVGTLQNVSEYAPGASSPFRTITKGINTVIALQLDSSGRLYVANEYANTVTVYPRGSTSPAYTISQGIEQSIGACS